MNVTEIIVNFLKTYLTKCHVNIRELVIIFNNLSDPSDYIEVVYIEFLQKKKKNTNQNYILLCRFPM